MSIFITSGIGLLIISGCTSHHPEKIRDTGNISFPVLGATYPYPSPTQDDDTTDDDTPELTVINNERGLFFGFPYDPNGIPWYESNSWDDIGAYIGQRHADQMRLMQSEAIKGVHGRLQHFHSDDATYAYFPYDELKEFEAAEIKAGRAPLFVTATYDGEQRPVYFEWLLNSDPPQYAQAVNVADERFAQFFVERYVHENLHVSGLENQWVGLDNCAFLYAVYGILDDNGAFVRTDGNNLSWDEPFPQNDDEWVDAIIAGIRNIKEIDPTINLICNEANASSEEKYERIYAELDGVILENFLYLRFSSSYEPFNSERLAQTFERLQGVNAEKVQIFQPRPTSGDDEELRTAYIGYLIMSGPNSFFGALDEANYEINPANYMPIRASLGEPTAAPTYEQVEDGSFGYRLYQREFEGGIVYLNWTGETQRIELPTGTEYRDRDGNIVTEIVLPDKTGDYIIDPTAVVTPPFPDNATWTLWIPILLT